MWFSTARGVSARWLCVGMENPPVGSRVYLYSCNAGQKLLSFLLEYCECFGHLTEVPMPTAGTRAVVLRYLDEVDRLVRDRSNVDTWREALGAYVNRALVEEAEKDDGNFMDSVALQLPRRSLGFVDE